MRAYLRPGLWLLRTLPELTSGRERPGEVGLGERGVSLYQSSSEGWFSWLFSRLAEQNKEVALPLQRIRGDEAVAQLNKNIRRAVWPDGRRPRSRLRGVAAVVPAASFSFKPGDRVLTIGSCFAREIERHLEGLGFDLPMMKIFVPEDERISGTPNDVLNKYSVHCMENEIKWAFEGLPFPEEKLFLQTEDNLWVDPHLGYNLPPTSFARVAARRADVMAAMRDLASSKVVIITLGLAESWFDLETNLYLNGAPPPESRKRYPGRFAVDVLNYSDILESLSRIHGLIRRHGRPDTKILITTSPVPFRATFTGDDALVANCYSKSVQRAACSEFISSHDGVDYFPSYEIVTLTDRSRAYTIDNIHVKPEVVAFIMDTVLEVYCPSLGVRPKQPEQSNENAAEKAQEAAIEAEKERVALVRYARRLTPAERLRLAEAFYKKAAYEKSTIMYGTFLPSARASFPEEDLGRLYTDYGIALLLANKAQRSVEILELALRYTPNNARLNSKLGISYCFAGDEEAGLHYLGEAAKLEPSVAMHQFRLAEALVRLRRFAEGRQALEAALAIDPNFKQAGIALAALNKKAASSVQKVAADP